MARHYDNLRRLTFVVERAIHGLHRAVSGIAFWTAIVVPIGYISFMVHGVDTESQLTTLVALVVVNYVALLLGHSHYDSQES